MPENKLEFTIGFKPILDGLNRATTAIQQRLAVVRDFNRSIENGSAAVNTLLSQAATFVGGAKIFGFFSGVVRDGVKFNATLEQSRLGIAAVLKQFDDTGKFKSFDDAITTASGALELLKQKAVTSPASFEALVQAFQGTVGPMTSAGIQLKDQVNLIVNMSQALAGLGIRSEQILQETRALITGNINADAAAAKILNITAEDIRLATEAGNLYEFLSSKIAAFAEAGARGANTLATLRSNFGDLLQQRAADAMLKLNEKLKTLYERLTALAGSKSFAIVLDAIALRSTQVVDKIGALVQWFTNLGPVGQGVLRSLLDGFGRVAVVMGGALATAVLLRGAFSALLLVVNPLRNAFIALSGVSLSKLVVGMQAMTSTYGMWKSIGVMNWGERLGAVALVATVGTMSYQVGSFVEQIRIGQFTISGWLAFIALSFEHLADRIGVAMYQAWSNIRVGLLEKLTEAKLKIIEFARDSAEAINRVVPRRFEIDTSGFEAAAQRARAQLEGLDRERGGVFNNVVAKLIAYTTRYVQAVDTLKQIDQANTPEAKAQAHANALQAQLDAARKAAETAAQKKAREDLVEKQALFAVENKILLAEAAGDQAAVERLTRERDRLRLTRELTDEKVKDAALDARTKALVETRLNAELWIREQVRLRQTQERSLADELARLAQQRALTEGNRFLTQEEKQRRVVALLEEENRLIAERIALLDAQIKSGVDEETERQLRDRIDQLQAQLAQNAGTQAQQRPLEVAEAPRAGVVGFLNSLGTQAEAVSEAITGTLNGALQGTSDALYGLFSGAKTFREAWDSAIASVGQSFARMAADMVAKMLWRSTVERALNALGLAHWLGTEHAKTAATTQGVGARLLLVAREAMADVYHGAVAAFKAMAGIPVVGPILGTAALAAALALGIGLVSKIGGHADGGIVRGGRQLSWLNEEGVEAVIRAPVVSKFGTTFMEDLNAGLLNLAALPDDVAVALPKPYGGERRGAMSDGQAQAGGASAGGAAGPTYVAVFFDQGEATRWLSTKRGRKILQRRVGQDRRDMGIET